MSIKRRGGEEDANYFYRFTYKGKDFCEGGFRTKEQAKEAERLAMNLAIEQHQHPEDYAGEMTFRQAGEWWLKEYVPKKRSGFVDAGRLPLIMDYFDKMTLRQIQPPDIDTFLSKVSGLRMELDKKRGQASKPMSDHTKNHYRALIHAIYERLKKKRMYSGVNPCSFVDKIPVPTVKTRFLYPAEERILTPAIQAEPDLYDYYLLGVELGMRIGEMRSIRVRDVDMTLKYIFIGDPSAQRAKNNQSRYVPFDSEWDASHSVIHLLKRRMAGKGPEEFLLPHWGYTYIKDHLYAILEALDIKEVTIHIWRHSFAYHRLSHGQPLYIVSKLLGHSSQSVTEKHYGHLDISKMGDVKMKPEPFLSCNRFATAEKILKEIKEEIDLKDK